MREFAMIGVLAAAGTLATAQPDYEYAHADAMQRFGVAQAPETTPGAIRVTTYNIENLFDDVDDPALTGDNDDIDDEKPEHELKAVARVIRRVNADVLCLQEVESESALLAFRDAYLADMGYEHVVSIDAGTGRGIEQSVLSRFPLANARNWPGEELGGIHPEKYGNSRNWHAGEPITFRRSPMLVDVTVPADAAGNAEPYRFTVSVVHHKSGRHSGYWREKEAAALAEKLDAIVSADPSTNLVVLGDFNALETDKSVGIYLDEGFTNVVERHAGPESDWVTHESGRIIDLILMNSAMTPEVVSGSAFVLGSPARPEGVSWREAPTFEGYASDHYPVSVDVRPVDAADADASASAEDAGS